MYHICSDRVLGLNLSPSVYVCCIVRTNAKRDSSVERSPNVDMDSYIEDLLSDEKAIDVLVGSLTDNSNR